MSSEIGAISQYALSVQQMQLSLIKANIDLQKQAIEVLLGDDSLGRFSLGRPWAKHRRLNLTFFVLASKL